MSSPFKFGDIVSVPSLNNKIGTIIREIPSPSSSTSTSSYEIHFRGFPTTMIFSQSDISPQKLFQKYEVKESPFHGRGLFATSKIEPGEVILRECQTIPFIQGDDDCVAQKDFDIDTKIPSQADQKLLSRLTGGCLHSLPLNTTSAEEYETVWSQNNNGSMTSEQLSQVVRFNQFLSAGLCFLCAHANHSCAPNATFEVDDEDFEKPDDQGLVMFAIRSIQPGEEIFISYTTLKNRSPSVFKKFGFECKCTLCTRLAKNPQDEETFTNKIQKLFDLKTAYLQPEHRNKAETLAEEAISLCDEILQTYDVQQILRTRTAILGEVFQLLAQVDYFDFARHRSSKKNDTKKKKNWYDGCLVWLTKFLAEYAKPGACRGATTSKFKRIYQIHTHFLKQPDEFGELIENQIFSQIMAGNYQ